MALRITKRRDNFAARIRQAPDKARKLEEKHCKAWADVMRQIMPVDTGAMRDSTEAVQLGTGGWGVRIGVNYWSFVENGTIFQSGQFFVRESREFVRRGFLKDLKDFAKG